MNSASENECCRSSCESSASIERSADAVIIAGHGA